jgi:hypothetical protein
MVVGTIFEVGPSGLEVAGLINTAERILSALFSTGSKNGNLRSLCERRRSGAPERWKDQGLLHGIARQTASVISAGVRVPTGKTGS